MEDHRSPAATPPVFRRFVRVGIAAALALGAHLASAAELGTYVGVTGQGLPVSLTVVQSPTGRGTEISSIQFSYALNCATPESQVSLGITMTGAFRIGLVGGFQQAIELADEFYTQFDGRFDASGNVGGRTSEAMSVLTQAVPHVSELCSIGPLLWRAHRQAGNAPTTAAPQVDYIVDIRLDREGQVIDQSIRSAR